MEAAWHSPAGAPLLPWRFSGEQENMKIVLIGAGKIGRALIRDVLDLEKGASILAVDFDARALEAAAALGFGSRLATRRAEATWQFAEKLTPSPTLMSPPLQ